MAPSGRLPRFGSLVRTFRNSSFHQSFPSFPMTQHASDVASEIPTKDVTPEGQASIRYGQNPGGIESMPNRPPRGRTGCLNCRRRRKKCDEKKPTCSKCKRFEDKCEWDSGVVFRLSGIDSDHPSMKTKKSSTQNFHMVDVTFDSSTHRRIESRKPGKLPSISTPYAGHLEETPNTPAGAEPGSSSTTKEPQGQEYATPEYGSLFRPDLSPLEGPGHLSQGGEVDSALGQAMPRRRYTIDMDTRPHQLDSPRGSISSMGIQTHSALPNLDGFSTAELEALDYLTSHTTAYAPCTQADAPLPQADTTLCWPTYEATPGISPPFHAVMADSPDTFSMYYPNAEYRELHATLYNHMVDTARSTGLTRQGTPEPPTQTVPRPFPPDVQMAEASIPYNSTPRVSKPRELVLWRNYLDEIATWLDMFDNDRHFQNSLPLMAQYSQHLRLSMLALSARQIERMDPNKPYTESLGLYQDAIHMIVQDLQSMDTAVIASCVLLCVLEMMSSSPRDWARHLDGCAMLIKAAGINGVVGGVRQAIFWCFARMDMWGGFLTDSNLKIPTSLWFLPSGSMSTAVNRFKSDFKSFDQYANFCVFLCASALNVISDNDKISYSTRWKTLFDLLEDWYSNRPPEMRSILSGCDEGSSFPIIAYTNPPAISGNQLYHAAALLMLQAKPRDIKIRSHKSIFWHARQICGITASNPDQYVEKSFPEHWSILIITSSSYTNAPQMLWIAGRVLSHPSEHRIVLDLLTRIERETGFATAWRAEDLKVHWGEFDGS